MKQNAKGKGHGHVTPLQELWANFIDEFAVNIEWTTSKFGGGSRLFFVRVGSWSKVHPFMMPQQIWKNKENYKVPRLCVDRLTQDVARAIGEMDLHQVLDPLYTTMLPKSSDPPNAEEELPEYNKDVEEMHVQVFDKEMFPLLHYLGVCQTNMMDRQLQELLNFFGKQRIVFNGANNRRNELFLMPSSQTRLRYEEEVLKKDSILDLMLQSMAKDAMCSVDEATECMLKVLSKKNEDLFADVAMKNDITGNENEKMDIISRGAMLSEARIGTKSARVLFRHIKQFLGRPLVQSERKRKAYFGSNDFPPTCKQKQDSHSILV